MQVLTTNLQTNGIIAGLNINWPNSLRSIQNIFNVVQSSMVNTVSMDCSLQYWDSEILSMAQIEAVIAMLIPIGMLGVFIVMWTCRSVFLTVRELPPQCQLMGVHSAVGVWRLCARWQQQRSSLNDVLVVFIANQALPPLLTDTYGLRIVYQISYCNAVLMS